MAISGKGEGKAKAAAKETPRVPRARGRLDWSMIYRNATSSDLEGLRVALLDMIRLGLGWDKFYDSKNSKPRRRKYCRCKKLQT